MFDCCISPDEREARKVDKRINAELRKYKRQTRKEYKLLLLGAGESGKSTFIKQMRIIHGTGYSVSDRRGFIKLVYENVVVGMQKLVMGCDAIGVSFERQENLERAREICAVDYMAVRSLDDKMVEAVSALWLDSGVQRAYARRNEFYISDSAGYFLKHVERIAEPDYLPTQEDILRARAPTSGILEYSFVISDNVNFRLIDVGGQERLRY